MRKGVALVNLNYRAFGFRNNLLSHNQDIAVCKPKLARRADITDKDTEVSAFGNFWNSSDWMNSQAHVASSP